MNEMFSSVLPALGPTAAVVLVVYYFLRHTSTENQLHREMMTELVSRVESIETGSREVNSTMGARLERVTGEFRAEHRTTINQLMTLNREAIGAMSVVSLRVDELGSRVSDLGGAIDKLSDRVERYDHRNEGDHHPDPPKQTGPK